MSSIEICSSVLLAFIFSLRMLGLFLILPIFTVYAKNLSGSNNTVMIGLAMGIYGLMQSFFHIPFGIASDKYGRKYVIIIGLILFAFGAFVAARTNHIIWIIVGRAIQGTGAISAVIMAFIADFTRAEHRTKAMAIIGSSIGFTFALSLIVSPILYKSIGMPGIFTFTGLLALIAIFPVIFALPNVSIIKNNFVPLSSILFHKELMRLNFGVFILHLTQMAMFVILPNTLEKYSGLLVTEHWKIYLPIILVSFVCILPLIFISEKYCIIKHIFLISISLLFVIHVSILILLSYVKLHWWILFVLLFIFFIVFNILEAYQPSLVSRIAPVNAKGLAFGIYNTLQALGLFFGGILAGLCKDHMGIGSVFFMCMLFTIIWFIIAFNMKNFSYRINY